MASAVWSPASLTQPLARRLGTVVEARRALAISGFAGASACIVLFTRVDDPVRAMFVLGLAGFFNDFVMPPAWAGCMDVGGRYAGTVSGAMNTFGSIAGAVSATFVGYLLSWTNNDWTTDLLHLRGDLQHRRPVLAVSRCPHAAGGRGCRSAQ